MAYGMKIYNYRYIKWMIYSHLEKGGGEEGVRINKSGTKCCVLQIWFEHKQFALYKLVLKSVTLLKFALLLKTNTAKCGDLSSKACEPYARTCSDPSTR